MTNRRRHRTGVNNLRNNPNRIYRIDEAKGMSFQAPTPEKRKELLLKRLERERKKREMIEPLLLPFDFDDDDD